MWTIGREREKTHAGKFVRQEDQRQLLYPVIDAVHDIKEGNGSVEDFIGVAQVAMMEGGSGVWLSTANWVRKVSHENVRASEIWNFLARHESWKIRWRVACCLYLDIDEPQSDHLFAHLRSDPSKKVRKYATDRYENRPDDQGKVEKRFDATLFET
ncbi:UNVERIFIED_ORG: hypothetical protein M2348_002343 [Sphingomonas sp. R1F5B]